MICSIAISHHHHHHPKLPVTNGGIISGHQQYQNHDLNGVTSGVVPESTNDALTLKTSLRVNVKTWTVSKTMIMLVVTPLFHLQAQFRSPILRPLLWLKLLDYKEYGMLSFLLLLLFTLLLFLFFTSITPARKKLRTGCQSRLGNRVWDSSHSSLCTSFSDRYFLHHLYQIDIFCIIFLRSIFFCIILLTSILSFVL